MGAASSLKGGRLIVSPMQGPMATGGILAMAQGAVVLEDPSTPTVGRIPGGCVMEADLPSNYIDNGQFSLILEDPSASWTTASTIAKIINDAEGNGGEILATAVDPKNIVVTIPAIETRHAPTASSAACSGLPFRCCRPRPALQINEQTGTHHHHGDVENQPGRHQPQGLTISTIARRRCRRFARRADAEGRDRDRHHQHGGAKLQDLRRTLDQIKVPAEDRIAIVKELFKTGKPAREVDRRMSRRFRKRRRR
jgi:flagellar basal body P-ring protein FlgI